MTVSLGMKTFNTSIMKNPVSAVGDLREALFESVKDNKTIIVRCVVVILNACLLAYLGGAIAYHVNTGAECMSWCDGLGFLIIMVSLLYLLMFYYLVIKRFLGKTIYKEIFVPCNRVWDKLWEYLLFRVALYVLLVAILVVFLVLDTADDRRRLISFLGLILILLFGFIFSKYPSQIKWRPVIWGLVLQFLFGLLTIRWDIGRQIFQCIGNKVSTFLSYTDAGSSFVYGNLLVTQEGVFAFQVMPVIFFFCFFVQILCYYGILQAIVIKTGWLLQKTLGTTVAESVNASASVFLGMSEAPLLIQEYLKDLTRSEIHAIMCAGFATVAGTVLAAYISFGVEPAHLITASVMSAPAALCYSKLFFPETEESRNRVEHIVLKKDDSTGVLDAAVKGVMNGISIVLGIIANIIAFVAFVAFVNGILGWAGGLIGLETLSLELIMQYVFMPLAWIMGVDWSECENVAILIGLKTIINEFVAYQRLGEMKKANLLSVRGEAIATYALCGFSNPGAVGILIGFLITLAPTKRADVTQVAIRAFIGGSAVCFLTASIAGILITDDMFPRSDNTTGTTTEFINYTTVP